MMLSRRLFLGILGSAVAFDPERLLWMPGKKVISVPKPHVRTLHHMTVDLLLEPTYLQIPLSALSEFCRIKEEQRDSLECEVRAFCESKMLRPSFRDLEIPADIPYTDRITDPQIRVQVAGNDLFRFKAGTGDTPDRHAFRGVMLVSAGGILPQKTNLERGQLGFDSDNYGVYLYYAWTCFYKYVKFPGGLTEEEWLAGVHEFSL